MLIAILSDTHMRDGGRSLPEGCLERLRTADLILHAGDVMAEEALAAMEAIGPPLVAVHGNVDSAALRARLPAERTLEVEGTRLAMVHDAGPSAGRLDRLRTRFPDTTAAIFGHSHLPLHEEQAGFQIFNPGSPTERRRAPARTMGIARVEGSRVTFELVEVG